MVLGQANMRAMQLSFSYILWLILVKQIQINNIYNPA